jgi:alcohol dehydrogenase class IV
VFDGDNLEARRNMSLGSHLAGVAFSNAGLGIVHALASTVGGMRDVPHGACLAASIEAGLRYNLPVRGTAYEQIARDLGLNRRDSDGPGESLIREIDRLRINIGLPGSFSAVGLSTDDTDAMVENTMLQERRIATTPRLPSDDLRDSLRVGF